VRVGIVGTGAIGMPMVRRLVGGGHRVTAHARRPEAIAELERLQVTVVPSAARVAEGAEVVVLCPFTDTQVRDIAIPDGLLAATGPATVVVIHTTGSPSTARALQDAAPHGVEVVDAPISGGPPDIEAGAVTLYVGGSDSALARARPVLAAYGQPILHLGPLGSGQLVKLINNALFAAQIQLAAAALRIGRGFGIDGTALADAVAAGSGASRAMTILDGDPDRLEGLRRFLAKDIDVLLEVATALPLDLGILGDAASAGFR
jgi:3-hydroxyisobutyrate dehydrogenase-like beta-hydroxyacid dehydrogenase